MSKYSQKEAVYAAVTAFLAENDRPFDDAMKVELETEDRKTIVAMIVGAIQSGSVDLTVEAAAKYNTAEKMHGYVTGLLSNWLRKDERLNGGEKHSIKEPGSRAGQTDSTVKALRALQRSLSLKEEINMVEEEIQTRLQELKLEKVKKGPAINLDLIPENLRHLYK